MKTTRHFLAYHAHFFLQWEMFQVKVAEEIKTHMLCLITFFFLKNCATYEIMWKNIVEWGRPQMIIWNTHIACWMTKATHTHNIEYLLLFYCNNVCKNVPQCYIIDILLVLLFPL
jgi:hypothetical protein